MRRFGLIGHPLGHSLSPQIHSRLFELSGETVDYQLYDIAPEELQEKGELLSSLDGFNITIPHKVSIIDYCSELSEGAQRYRSVNCVDNRSRSGYNTDVMGFTKSIEMMGASLCSDVLLIGCGGVGRMMAIETALSGGRLIIAALKSDEELAQQAVREIKDKKADADVQVVFINNGALCPDDFGGEVPRIDLLINATPVGMHPKTDRMPCTPEVLEKVSCVFDAVYNPKETLLAKTAREKGAKAMTGMAMLVLQAVAAHEIWDGASYNKEDIDRLISDMEELV